jgi:hypothetical protein
MQLARGIGIPQAELLAREDVTGLDLEELSAAVNAAPATPAGHQRPKFGHRAVSQSAGMFSYG